VSDSSRRGVLESQGTNCWAVRFADQTLFFDATGLMLLPAEGSFEPSQAPLSFAERSTLQTPSISEKPSISEPLWPGARVCLVSDSARRGVIESQANGGSSKNGYWTVRFADKSRNIRTDHLKLLPSDAASFEPSQAPLTSKERRRASSAPESTCKRQRVAEGTVARDTHATALESRRLFSAAEGRTASRTEGRTASRQAPCVFPAATDSLGVARWAQSPRKRPSLSQEPRRQTASQEASQTASKEDAAPKKKRKKRPTMRVAL